MKLKHVICSLALLIGSLSSGYSQQQYQPSPENLKNREWFEQSRFGVFIHWGVYSVLGDGEWVMNNQNISLDEYALLPKFFNPISFDAKEWAKLFKQAGAKYITFTTRHHDGFAMWNSQTSDYNIVKKSPFKRDIVKELVAACHAEGIKVMFYYSLLDWKRDDYLPAGKTGGGIAGRDSTKGDWNHYVQFMKSQLTELLTSYGQVDGIWFDGHWDKPKEDWHFKEIYELIHKLQPQCLVGNNHHLAPFEGEDFQMFERDLPGENTTGFGTSAHDVGKLPKEVCGTIAGSWGFELKDRTRKSFREVLTYLVKAAGHGSNLLLNVGPMPNGEIQDYQQDRLKDLGKWLAVYGETIYGTEAGGVPPTDDYALTRKGNQVYLHILKPEKKELYIAKLPYQVKKVKTFIGNKDIKFSNKDNSLRLDLPAATEEANLVLTLTIK
ncbi:alpha-L-fucosidase [Sphingobacterium sp. CZ-UAM]|jgi:alpha-L-fucosidase|uniref:alpha-L-fucosidase n=1 Tax=Sphingobacterium sp. CZ-UAM TaxID=1933868 RepID=UPI000987A66A|nr:alpha-L-fucosidase [Sphingobacterium sp. CZ-UAM]OOG17738.1 alpha-L-fucosidase [Sphingobacterium sp. CZ-UAM]